MKSRADLPGSDTLQFGGFTLDPANRRLSRDGEPIELGGRYLDALVMLVKTPGQLISKDRLHEEVWRGIPVTDEALSQAIMAVRKALGDDAARPRFIETVPRHGYRFIGTLEERANEAPTTPAAPAIAHHRLRIIAGGIVGAAAAGLVVGLVYGSLAAGSGAGSAFSLVLVLVCVSILAALVSGLGIAGGIGWLGACETSAWWRPVAGGMLGGLLVGGFARLLGLDTLRLLTGGAPDRIAGAGEGLVIGIAAGIGYWLVLRNGRIGLAAAALLGAFGGAVIVLAGGTLMAGSLAALVAQFPGAGLSLGWAAATPWLIVAGAFEGALFSGLLVAGMTRARRHSATMRPERR